MMGGRVDKSEAQSALRVVQALFAFLKKKEKIMLLLRKIKNIRIKNQPMYSFFKKV